MYSATHKRNLKLFLLFLQGMRKSRKYTCLRFFTRILGFFEDLKYATYSMNWNFERVNN